MLGGLGLVAGVKGTQKTLYTCTKCGFSHEYEGSIATKDIIADPLEGYKNKGVNATWIETINKATPNCVFCGEEQNLYVKYQNGLYKFICPHCLAIFELNFTFVFGCSIAVTSFLNVPIRLAIFSKSAFNCSELLKQTQFI